MSSRYSSIREQLARAISGYDEQAWKTEPDIGACLVYWEAADRVLAVLRKELTSEDMAECLAEALGTINLPNRRAEEELLGYDPHKHAEISLRFVTDYFRPAP